MKLPMNIMADDHDKYMLLPSSSLLNTNSVPSLNNDKLVESLKTLTNLLNDFSRCIGNTTSKLKGLEGDLGTKKSAETLSERASGLVKQGLESITSYGENSKKKTQEKKIEKTPEEKSSGALKKNIDALKGFKPNDADFTKISKSFEDLSGMFGSDKSTAKVMEWSKGFADAAGSIVKGDPIGALMNVGKTLSSIIATNKQAEKEIKQFYNELEQAAINYSIKSIAAAKDIKSGTDSIFDADTTNRLSKGMTGYNDAAKMMDKLNKRLGDEDILVGKKKKKVLGVTTGTKNIWGDFKDSYKSIIGTDKDLIDSTGKLDMVIADSLLNSGKLSTEASTTLKQMVAVQTAADAAMAQVNATLTQTAGTLGSSLETALVSAFQSGESAANDFSKSVSSILEKIITDQMFNIVFGEMLKNLEKDMQASYNEGGDQTITDDIAKFYKGYGTKVDDFNKGLAEMQSQVNGMTGLNVLPKKEKETLTQSSTRGAVETMTQDQAGELNGRFTALQMSTANIEGDVRGLLDLQTQNSTAFIGQSNSLLQLCSTNVQSMYYLEDIKKNTNHLAGIKQDLQDIKQNTSRL